MNHDDVILSLLAAVAMAGLTSLGLVRVHKEGVKTKVELDTADVDVVALTAIVTFVAMMMACHPEWVF
jgi:hypothetical protein